MLESTLVTTDYEGLPEFDLNGEPATEKQLAGLEDAGRKILKTEGQSSLAHHHGITDGQGHVLAFQTELDELSDEPAKTHVTLYDGIRAEHALRLSTGADDDVVNYELHQDVGSAALGILESLLRDEATTVNEAAIIKHLQKIVMPLAFDDHDIGIPNLHKETVTSDEITVGELVRHIVSKNSSTGLREIKASPLPNDVLKITLYEFVHTDDGIETTEFISLQIGLDDSSQGLNYEYCLGEEGGRTLTVSEINPAEEGDFDGSEAELESAIHETLDKLGFNKPGAKDVQRMIDCLREVIELGGDAA